MRLRQIATVCLATIAAIVFSLLPSSSALAEGNQSNQDLNRSAVLVAPSPNSKIRVYLKPGKNQQQIGYGLGGDSVVVQEQVSSNEGYTWNYVRFEHSPQLEGWIRSDFVAVQSEQDQQETGSSVQKGGWKQQTNFPNPGNKNLARQQGYQGNSSQYQGQRQYSYNQSHD
jgi:hypothetical protein